MSVSPITLGQINLQNFEIPTSIKFGGQQRLVVHRLADGSRLIEPLGPDDREIAFHGIFSGPTAEDRVRAMDQLRIGGTVVTLAWEAFRYNVILKDFAADYQSPWWIAYRVSCVIIDPAGILSSLSDSGLAQVKADLAQASTNLQSLPVSLTGLSASVLVPDFLTIGTTANSQAAAVARGTLSAINSEIAAQSAALISDQQPAGDAATMALLLSSQLSCAAGLAALVCARSYIGRVSTTISSAGS